MFTLVVIFASTLFCFIGYCVGRAVRADTDIKNSFKEADQFTEQMKTEYQRGLNLNAAKVTKLEAELSASKTKEKTLQSLQKQLDIALTERDQYVHQIEDLVEEQKELSSKIAKLTTRKLQLKQQIENLKENHGYELIDHGNTIREEILSEIEEFVESKKSRPKAAVEQPTFKVSAVGNYTNPSKVNNPSDSPVLGPGSGYTWE